MGPGRVSTITGFFFNKHEGGKCNMQEEHEPNQNSEKKKDRNKENCKNENYFANHVN